MKEILAKLSAIQAALKAPKGQFNSYGGFKYRSCEDILEAVKPLLKEQGVTMTICDDIRQIGDRYYVTANITLFDTESGETYTNTAFAREEENKKGMDGSQITGTASSYARKYALNGLFLIDDTKDADTDEFTKQQKNAPEPPPVVCPMCGKELKPIKKRGGKVVQPAEILEKCGGVCYDCYQTAKNGGDMFTAPDKVSDTE